MNSVPASRLTSDQESLRQGFRIVDTALEPPLPGISQKIDPSLVLVDYNSQPALARGLARFDWRRNFSLSLGGVILLASSICLATILVCLFLLPRL